LKENIHRLFSFAIFFLLLSTHLAVCAFFDCSKAVYDDEKAICSNEELNALDERLGNMYQDLMKNILPDSAQKIKAEQKAWLEHRKSACGSNIGCLIETYQDRIDALSKYEDLLKNSKPSNPNNLDTAIGLAQAKNENDSNVNIEPTPEPKNASTIKAAKQTLQTGSNKEGIKPVISPMNLEFIKIGLVIVMVAFLTLLILGFSKKVVIFFDGTDFFLSLLPFFVPIIGIILMVILNSKGQAHISKFWDITTTQMVVLIITFIAEIVSVVLTFTNSIKYNRNVAIGILIGFLKFIVSILGFLLILSQVAKIMKEHSTYKQMFIATIFIGLFAWILGLLINGEQVYLKKGWELP